MKETSKGHGCDLLFLVMNKSKIDDSIAGGGVHWAGPVKGGRQHRFRNQRDSADAIYVYRGGLDLFADFTKLPEEPEYWRPSSF